MWLTLPKTLVVTMPKYYVSFVTQFLELRHHYAIISAASPPSFDSKPQTMKFWTRGFGMLNSRIYQSSLSTFTKRSTVCGIFIHFTSL